jgi:MoxR-like ATPase
VTRFVQELREMELYKIPGVAETLDWTRALMALDKESLDEGVVEDTLGALLKYRDDVDKVRGDRSKAILERVAAAG